MGGFCVFGVSRQHCRRAAEKKVLTFDQQTKRCYSPVEWGALVLEAANRMFNESRRPVKISPEFDTPQFCHDWIAVSPNEVRLTRLMYRGEKINKQGAVVKRNGVPVLTWLPYDASLVAQSPFDEQAVRAGGGNV